jgi:long-chain acyl-CoA synthetase
MISRAEAAAAAEQKHIYPPFEFSTLAEMHVKSCEKYNERRCFGTRVGDKYEWISYSDFGKRVQKFRNVLAHNGVTKGDRVAIISNNRVEWAVAFYGVATIGGSLVPMYEAQLEKDWKYIINDSGAKVVIAANDTIYKKVSEYIGTVGELKSAICLDADPSQTHSYANWMQKVDSEAPVPVAAVTPNDLATIIYTSGTTGNPKGVELSHENLSSNIKGTVERWKVTYLIIQTVR